MKHLPWLLLAAALTFGSSAFATPDPDFHIYLCFGQSNRESGRKMEGQDKTVDARFLVLAAADSHFNSAGSREFGKRYGEKMLSVLGHKPGEAK